MGEMGGCIGAVLKTAFLFLFFWGTLSREGFVLQITLHFFSSHPSVIYPSEVQPFFYRCKNHEMDVGLHDWGAPVIVPKGTLFTRALCIFKSKLFL